MLSPTKSRPFGLGLLAALFCVALALPLVAADTAKEPEDKPAEKADPFVVPKGTPEELLKYIETLGKERPTSNSDEVVKGFFKKRSAAMIEAADSILAQKPTEEQAKTAVKLKTRSLQVLEHFGDTGAAKKLEAMPAELEKAGFKDLVREVQAALLQRRLQRAGELSKEDFAKLLAEVKAYLAKEKTLDRGAAMLAMGAAMAAEQSDDTEVAVSTYQDFGKLLAKSEDKNVATRGAMMQGAARRLGLVGNPITIEGTTVEGKPFDWAKYKGKVVLIDFFATWCGPCRAEMPNVEKNYEAYHNKGFDVVTISVDENRKDLDEFLEQNKHPWTVLHDNADARGTDKSMGTYYGIMGIPQMILVGKDGKVVTLNARGDDLGRELEKLLGPPAKREKKDEKGEKEPQS